MTSENAANLATITVGAPLLLIVIAILVAFAMKVTEVIERRRDRRREQEIEL